MDREQLGTERTDEHTEESNALTPAQMIGTAKDVVAKYCRCTICGAHLHFTHVTDFSRNLTQETARCPECGIKTRQVMHKLQ